VSRRSCFGVYPSFPRLEKGDQITPVQLWAAMNFRQTKGGTHTSKAGWREIAGKKIFFRSRWEYNYACYLQFLVDQGQIVGWAHEPETFWFEKIRRGVRSYLPDFRVTERDGAIIYHEVKGWLDPKSKTKLKRMAKYHPLVRLRVIDSKWFRENGPKMRAVIPGWETDSEKGG